ncbi:MAG: hypothetical protein ACYCVW_17095 [Rhodocyclaceae bacterium]
MAEETALRHVWRRARWCDDAEASIGPLIRADRAGIIADIEAGLSQLFHVEGPDYGGWFLIRFYQDEAGDLACFCIAFNGRNTEAGLPHLVELVRAAGAVELICTTEQEAVARLYRRQGWTITEYELRFDLRKTA